MCLLSRLRQPLAFVVAGVLLTACGGSAGPSETVAESEVAGGAGSCPLEVTFEGRISSDHPVAAALDVAGPLGQGQLASCEDGTVSTLELARIQNVDPEIAVAVPSIPTIVLVSVPWADVPDVLKE